MRVAISETNKYFFAYLKNYTYLLIRRQLIIELMFGLGMCAIN